MKKASSVALAIGGGYLLGRKRKWRLAMLLAGAAATGKVGGMATQVIKRGGSAAAPSGALTGALGNLSPELGKVMGTVRGDLADAGKAAVRAAAVNRINQLTDSLAERAEGIRSPRDADEGEAQEREPQEREPEEPDEGGGGAADTGPGSGRREGARPRRREPSGRDTEDRPRRRREPERGDRGGGPGRRAANRPAAGGSRSAPARKGGK
jgi:hypothetical protein